MRAPVQMQARDFTLQQLILPAEIGAKVQAGQARLVVVPLQEQPTFDRIALEELGLSETNGQALVTAVRQAFRDGVIDSSICPIAPGGAFDLLQLSPSLKPVRFGTGIVLRIIITRLDLLTARQWRASGHQSQAGLLEYWTQFTPASPTTPAPWCWLIHFDLKG
ncbi:MULTISPECIES: hypothetical protein [Pseudomonas]|uniref:hypothetical protein n=1 Tax=Pseudomonas TaxID=286 RepID=UPI000761A57B|nr:MULTISPECIES: hypothetical protein [Pseudomonas]MDG9809511.1 hypothetical protein [Pseudomonas juntendi]MDG9815757.1 hypothetical protein [Pseudomonas putida]